MEGRRLIELLNYPFLLIWLHGSIFFFKKKEMFAKSTFSSDIYFFILQKCPLIKKLKYLYILIHKTNNHTEEGTYYYFIFIYFSFFIKKSYLLLF